MRKEHLAQPHRRHLPHRPGINPDRRSQGRADVPGTGPVPVAHCPEERRERHAVSKATPDKAKVKELLSIVHLEEFADRRPHELSGGMQQRAALARALAQDADILLMDEPFGALDAMTRTVLHDELERIWQATGVSIVFVTHDVREAVRLGDRVILLSSRPGRVVDEVRVPLERPRRLDSANVNDIAQEVTDRLRQQVRHHV